MAVQFIHIRSRGLLAAVLAVLVLSSFGCAAPEPQTVSPRWVSAPPGRVVVLGFHTGIIAGTDNPEDTVRVDEWWSSEFNQQLATALRREHPEHDFVAVGEVLEQYGEDRIGFEVAVTRAMRAARRDGLEAFGGPWLQELLDRTDADAVYIGLLSPWVGTVSQGNLVAETKRFMVHLDVRTGLVDRSGHVLWETKMRFPTATSKSTRILVISGPEPNVAETWRINGPHLAQQCLDYYAGLFPVQGSTEPPAKEGPVTIPLLMSHPDGIRIELPSGTGPWSVTVLSEARTIVREFPDASGRVDWDFTDQDGERVGPGQYQVELQGTVDQDSRDGTPGRPYGQTTWVRVP